MGHISRRRRSSSGGGGSGGNIAFGAIIILIIYLVVTGIAGNWVAKYVITPVFSSFGKSTTQAQQQKDDEKVISENIKLDSGSIYFLQLGVFDKEKNAEDQAALIRLRGAAGYILNSDGKYRVLAWGYKTQADAQQVKQQLLDSENTTSEVYSEKALALTLKVTGKQSDVTVIKNSIGQYKSYLDRIENVSVGLDKNDLGAEAVKNEITKVNAEMSDIHKNLVDIDKNADNSCVKAIAKLYETHISNLSKLITDTLTTVQLTSKVKFAYVNMYYGYSNMLKGLK